MQENRSFDHCFGTLRGVRGFNDPRAVSLPNHNPVWLQTDAAGETYRLSVLISSTPMLLGSVRSAFLGRPKQARKNGDHDNWLIAKPLRTRIRRACRSRWAITRVKTCPFITRWPTLSPFAINTFCSSLTGTTPNRLYLWTGTIREEQRADSPANVLNENVDYGVAGALDNIPGASRRRRRELEDLSKRDQRRLAGSPASTMRGSPTSPIIPSSGFPNCRLQFFAASPRAHRTNGKTLPAET